MGAWWYHLVLCLSFPLIRSFDLHCSQWTRQKTDANTIHKMAPRPVSFHLFIVILYFTIYDRSGDTLRHIVNQCHVTHYPRSCILVSVIAPRPVTSAIQRWQSTSFERLAFGAVSTMLLSTLERWALAHWPGCRAVRPAGRRTDNIFVACGRRQYNSFTRHVQVRKKLSRTGPRVCNAIR